MTITSAASLRKAQGEILNPAQQPTLARFRRLVLRPSGVSAMPVVSEPTAGPGPAGGGSDKAPGGEARGGSFFRGVRSEAPPASAVVAAAPKEAERAGGGGGGGGTGASEAPSLPAPLPPLLTGTSAAATFLLDDSIASARGTKATPLRGGRARRKLHPPPAARATSPSF